MLQGLAGRRLDGASSRVRDRPMEVSSMRREELEFGQEREALAFLEREPVRNLRMVWALRRWGLFNLGLAEQGRYLAARGREGIRGMLMLNNQGMLRVAARGDVARELVERALSSWGIPEVLAGPEEEIEEILGAVKELMEAVEHREEEVSLALSARQARRTWTAWWTWRGCCRKSCWGALPKPG